ncbi:HlyD family secretion protein [Magnetospirillum fulvum]|uniref:HlyD family secretion protein n=1 Tax=Magnetospirillum fulvum TaxID=1082 RepID=A0A1H6H532_MAGFU|nr:HlyD family efflux transporter periplasmic adaptor subunit [Magnetospirillum fulvum]SEH30839.1 HlyD family secretion protein [Magnetospirillum fulvum]
MTRTDAIPDAKTEIRIETRTETGPDGKLVAKSEIRTETKTETDPDTKNETVIETRTETRTETTSDARIEPKAEAKPAPQPAAQPPAPSAPPEPKKPPPETAPKPPPAPAPKPARTKWIAIGATLLVAAGLGFLAWDLLKPKQLGPGFASGNGRIEAVEIDVAAKLPGRLAEILVKEGEVVTRGQILARMDTQGLDAQLAEATADLARAFSTIVTAESQVTLRQSERAATLAVVAQRKAELNVAGKRLARSRTLSNEGAAAVQEYDDDLAGQQGSAAAVAAAQAQVAAADAAILTARAQVVGARASADAARATMARIESDIEDSALKSPRDGRVQYRVAQAAEVIAAGGKVLNLVDLADVYMTFFLPDVAVGKVALESEVRLVLDAAPQWVIPAKVSFVADVAQFTPKSVETASERQKLMFRVRARLDPELLKKFSRDVKTGLPGMAYIRLDPAQAWPDHLALHVPQ